MSGSRKEMLSDAIKAEVGAAPADLKTLFTDDFVGWSPYVTVSGLAGLAASFASVAPCRNLRCPFSVNTARHGSPPVSGG